MPSSSTGRMRGAAVLAAAAILATTGGAFAGPPTESGPTSVLTDTVVTLPTGDRVRVDGAGPIRFEPAGADTGYFAPRSPDGDRVVIPSSEVDDVAAGRLDVRLFNVDALLRGGYTDAREVPSADLLGGRNAFAATDPAADAEVVPVTVTFAWLDGSAAPGSFVYYQNLDTEERDLLFSEDGRTVEAKLPPGRYTFIANMFREGGDTAPNQVVGTVTDLRLKAKPVTLKVDGRKAKAVGFDTDRPAERVFAYAAFFNHLPGTTTGIGSGWGLGAQDEVYAIPSAAPVGHKSGLEFQEELAGPGAAYTYSLMKVTKGVPGKTAFTVHDAGLIKRVMDYRSLGVDTELHRRNLASHRDNAPFTYLPSAPAPVPSVRTEFYTPDPLITWAHLGTFGDPKGESTDDVMHSTPPQGPGRSTVVWNQAPLSVGLTDPAFPYFGSGFEYWSRERLLLARPAMFTGGGESIYSFSDGQAAISHDGVELATSEGSASVGAEIPAGTTGRFTVTSKASREVPWTPLGLTSWAEWSFEVDTEAGQDSIVDASVVRFSASGVVSGYAQRDEPQTVSLEYATQPGGRHDACTAMTFEVSYDDGLTWTAVDIARTGDLATATLTHPADANFVSVRFTAADANGDTVEHGTIRSYGLK